MILVSLATIPQRIKNIKKTVESLLNQSLKPDKIFINIPEKFRRFTEVITEDQIPKFNNDIVEITRCEDCGPGTKLIGSLNKIKKSSLIILVDDDHIYENYMIEKFYHFYSISSENAYSFYVHPIGNFGIGQGADGFAINTNHLEGIKKFYDFAIKEYKELFLYDDLWISYFLYYLKRKKILSLGKYLKKNNYGKYELIYKKHTLEKGLISTYGNSLIESVKKRDRIALESLKYLSEKIKNFKF